MGRVLLIDGNNLFVRVFSSVISVSPNGSHVGAITGFLRSLSHFVKLFLPERVFILFDGVDGNVNKRAINKDYKVSRRNKRLIRWENFYDSPDQERESQRNQLARLRDYLSLLPVSQLCLDKLEADDLIGYLVKRLSWATIISTDKDFYQLLSSKVSIYNPFTKKLISEDNAQEFTGLVHPTNYLLTKALCGDRSDSLRGVRGLGPKTCVKKFPELVHDIDYPIQLLFDKCVREMDSAPIFAKILSEWDLVEQNHRIMDLSRLLLDDKEKSVVHTELDRKKALLDMKEFVTLLNKDNIDGLSRDLDSWLLVFATLIRVA